MSALKNQFQRARMILESLIQGVHPKSGLELPQDSVINEIEVNRAMSTAVSALDQINTRLARRAQLPEGVGKLWTDDEEQRLIESIKSGDPIPDIATKHSRTVRAIEARLAKLGFLRPDQRSTNDPVLISSPREDE
jgi:hypothetical protein